MAGILSIVIWIVVIVGIVKSFSGSDTKKTQSTQNSTQKTVQQIRNGAQKIMSEISAYANDMEQGTNTGNRTSYNQPQNSTYNARVNQPQNNTSNMRTNQSQAVYNAQQTPQKRQMTAAERAKLDAYRQQKATAKSAQPTNIVERAKQNANKYAEDTTLEQLEKEHKHSERESKAEAAYVAKEREEHRKLHTEPIPPVEEESLLGSVQDLMIKGYDGNLSFERDFVGEAMDLLNSFTVQ